MYSGGRERSDDAPYLFRSVRINSREIHYDDILSHTLYLFLHQECLISFFNQQIVMMLSISRL